MGRETPVHISKTVVALMLSLCWAASPARAEVARVIALTGNVTAVAGAAGPRSLSEGAAVDIGDVIATAADSAVQLRFTDGALLALHPNTQFRIDAYAYQANSPRESGFFSLLKGGLRTLSGLIGRANKQNYRMHTPIATVGIRGTDYSLRLCQDDCFDSDDGLYLSVAEGSINASNNAGSFDLAAGQYGYIRDANSPLTALPSPPEALIINTSDERIRFYPRYDLDTLSDAPGAARAFEFRGGDLVRCVP